jgi:hypothetical protein
MTRRPYREPTVLHRAPFRFDVGVGRNAVATAQMIIAELLGTPRESAAGKSAKVRGASRANKKGSAA